MILEKKYVCDTNVLLSSLLSKDSPPAKTIHYILRNGFFAFSLETFEELKEVLQRPKFDRYIAKEKRRSFLERIYPLGVFYEGEQNITLCRDPKDNKFLEVALASNASFLITGDEDLLSLHHIGNIPIITPRNFLLSHE